MSRNGAGVYSLPAGSTVTNGDTSDATDLNTPLSDIESDLNVARPIVAGGTGASSAPAALVNLGLTATAAEINVLDGVTSSTAELNVLDGIPGTLTATELGYVDGVTSAIQTQLYAKQDSGATLTSLEGLSLVAGDVIYATAADTLVRLPIGTAGQAFVVNAGATAPEWSAGSEIFLRLNADFAGTNATGAQNLLPVNVTLAASTQYEYELTYSLLKTAGATSHNVSVLWGGTATINNWRRNMITTSTVAATYSGVLASFGADSTQTTPINVSGTLASADTRVFVRERGSFSVNASGTVIPQYQLSSAPGGAYSTATGTVLRISRLGAAGANVSQGTWA